MVYFGLFCLLYVQIMFVFVGVFGWALPSEARSNVLRSGTDHVDDERNQLMEEPGSVMSVLPRGVGNSASTITATAILLAASLAGVAAPAAAATGVAGTAGAPALIGWSTGGLGPPPPPAPLPDWCTEDNPDPACHPPPPPRRGHFVPAI
jgi:hypothetical protein